MSRRRHVVGKLASLAHCGDQRYIPVSKPSSGVSRRSGREHPLRVKFGDSSIFHAEPGSLPRAITFRVKLPTASTPTGGRRLRILFLVAMAGLVVGAVQPYGIGELLILGHHLAEEPVYLVLVVFGMVVLFTFGLPGSLGLWLIAPFQPPLIATGLLLVGSMGGALGAYLFSTRFREDALPVGFAGRMLDLLSRHGGVLSQTALRILPGFPHSVLNFCAGILGLPVLRFLAAALLGLTVKWGVYATALYQLVAVVEDERALGWSAGAPLLALALLILIGAWARHRVAAG